MEAGAATELCHCDVRNKFIHEHFKLKSNSHLMYAPLLPLCTIQAFSLSKFFLVHLVKAYGEVEV